MVVQWMSCLGGPGLNPAGFHFESHLTEQLKCHLWHFQRIFGDSYKNRKLLLKSCY